MTVPTSFFHISQDFMQIFLASASTVAQCHASYFLFYFSTAYFFTLLLVIFRSVRNFFHLQYLDRTTLPLLFVDDSLVFHMDVHVWQFLYFNKDTSLKGSCCHHYQHSLVVKETNVTLGCRHVRSQSVGTLPSHHH